MSDSLESPWILEATADNFAAQVLENSARGPVLVNFWSPSVGPCLRLFPLLDKLEHGQGAVDKLIAELELETAFGLRPGTDFSKVVQATRHGYEIQRNINGLRG